MPGREPAFEAGHAAPARAEYETASPDVHDAVAPSGPSDAELLALARTGDAPAYGELFRRHAPAARALAMHLARHESEADDLVSEAFTKVLSALRNGHGPTAALRPYLLTAVRRVHVDRGMAAQRVKPVEDVAVYDAGEPFVDPALAGLERSLVARAYAQLPERWQTVLWHTEVEGMAPRDLAPLLGMSPNAVSALALRARSGLRDAYLAAHVPSPRRPECEATLPRLAAFVRGSTSQRENAHINRHLDDCEDCRTVLADLRDVGVGMRGVIAPLILGLAAPAYLANLASLGAAGAGVVGSSAGAGSGATGSALAGSGTASATSGAAASAGASAGGFGSLITAIASGGWVLAGTAALVAGAVVAGAVALGSRDKSPAAVAQSTAGEDADTHGSAEPRPSGGGSPTDADRVRPRSDVALPTTSPSVGAVAAVATETPGTSPGRGVDDDQRSAADEQPPVSTVRTGAVGLGWPGAEPGTTPAARPGTAPHTDPGTRPRTDPAPGPGTEPGSEPGAGTVDPEPEPATPPAPPAAPSFTLKAASVTATTGDRRAVLAVAITVTNPPDTAVRATLTVSSPRITFLDGGGCAPLGEGRTRCVVTLDGRSTTVLVPWRPRGIGNTGTVDVALELAVSGDVVDRASTRITVSNPGRGGD
ncbi:MAG TPA: sigma-70 family RNA polymerase sigma factor [Nocardioidaceae bacterium]|nr:sigma-70 family RNA polymerase sigma factor [Nocardioidaceae bacterium]